MTNTKVADAIPIPIMKMGAKISSNDRAWEDVVLVVFAEQLVGSWCISSNLSKRPLSAILFILKGNIQIKQSPESKVRGNLLQLAIITLFVTFEKGLTLNVLVNKRHSRIIKEWFVRRSKGHCYAVSTRKEIVVNKLCFTMFSFFNNIL